MKTTRYEEYLKEQLENDDFRREYEDLEEEFTIARR